MARTTVSFSKNVQEELERLANKKKVSVAWVVREAVERYLAAETPLFRDVS
jgi:predicted transcriptional regulator